MYSLSGCLIFISYFLNRFVLMIKLSIIVSSLILGALLGMVFEQVAGPNNNIMRWVIITLAIAAIWYEWRRKKQIPKE